MKKTLIAAVLISAFGVVHATDAKCDVFPNKPKKAVYERPTGKGFIAIPVGTPVLLTNQLGYKYPCRLGENVYPYVELKDGRAVARDLRNGQQILTDAGLPFEVRVGLPSE